MKSTLIDDTSTKQVAKAMGVSRSTALKHLKKLYNEGFIGCVVTSDYANYWVSMSWQRDKAPAYTDEELDKYFPGYREKQKSNSK